MKKSTVTILLIIAIVIFAVWIMTRNTKNVDPEIAKCIGEKAIVYSQIGCHFCEQQKEEFGNSYKYVNEFLCNSDNWETCTAKGITGTPTWSINETKYVGVQPIETLRQLTGC